MENIDRHLDEVLGIVEKPQKEIVKKVEKVTPIINGQDEDTDFQYQPEKTFIIWLNVVKMGWKNFLRSQTVRTSPAFEVVGQMIDKLTTTNKELLNLHKTKKDIQTEKEWTYQSNQCFFSWGLLVNFKKYKRVKGWLKLIWAILIWKSVGHVEWTEESVEEYRKCMEDPQHFIENYVKVIHVDKGLIRFDMYPYQKKMINSFINDRFVICKMPRQTGKSTTIISFLLHYILFNENVNCVFL